MVLRKINSRQIYEFSDKLQKKNMHCFITFNSNKHWATAPLGISFFNASLSIAVIFNVLRDGKAHPL